MHSTPGPSDQVPRYLHYLLSKCLSRWTTPSVPKGTCFRGASFAPPPPPLTSNTPLLTTTPSDLPKRLTTVNPPHSVACLPFSPYRAEESSLFCIILLRRPHRQYMLGTRMLSRPRRPLQHPFPPADDCIDRQLISPPFPLPSLRRNLSVSRLRSLTEADDRRLSLGPPSVVPTRILSS